MQRYAVVWTELDDAILHTTNCDALKALGALKTLDSWTVQERSMTAREFLNKFSSFSDGTLSAHENSPESLIRDAVDEASGYVTIHECATEAFERDMNALIDEHAGLA